MNNKLQMVLGKMLVAVGHLSGVAMIALGIALLILPMEHMQGVATRLQDVPELWNMSSTATMLHFGLSACVWAFLCIAVQFVRLRVSERKLENAPIRLSRGSVMTESLIVIPFFLLLVFGMAQLAINNIGGILANVAAYEAGRAAWVWQPEEDLASGSRRMSLANGTAVQKCRIAVALVMMPIAPGDYIKLSTLNSTFADKTRMMAVGANVPLFGVLSSLVPQAARDLAEAGVVVLGAGEAGINEETYARSLDGSQFWLRTIRKFTTAYLSAGCTINASTHEVQMTYRHHIAMPVVGRVFGTLRATGPGLRPGFYTDYRRTFGFQKQYNTPNNKMPKNKWLDYPEYSSSDPSFD